MAEQEHSDNSVVRAWDLFIPELERPFRAILDRPERIRVAWHRDARGVHELLDGNGKHNGITHREPLWRVREYERVECWETGARYVEWQEGK